MPRRLRSLIVLLIPLVMLGGLALWVSAPPSPPPPQRASGEGEQWIPWDLSGVESVDRLPGWEVLRGTYQLTEISGRKALKLVPEPIVEGKVRAARMMWGGGGVKARMRGDRSRRAFPRFSLGLHQDQELHLRAFPGERKLDLVACLPDLTNETLLASAPLPDWDWKPEDWIWLEFQILPVPGDTGNFRCEGRLWNDTGPRPALPQLEHRLTLPPSVFFAALQGASFALRPIWIDSAATLTRPLSGP